MAAATSSLVARLVRGSSIVQRVRCVSTLAAVHAPGSSPPGISATFRDRYGLFIDGEEVEAIEGW